MGMIQTFVPQCHFIRQSLSGQKIGLVHIHHSQNCQLGNQKWLGIVLHNRQKSAGDAESSVRCWRKVVLASRCTGSLCPLDRHHVYLPCILHWAEYMKYEEFLKHAILKQNICLFSAANFYSPVRPAGIKKPSRHGEQASGNTEHCWIYPCWVFETEGTSGHTN